MIESRDGVEYACAGGCPIYGKFMPSSSAARGQLLIGSLPVLAHLRAHICTRGGSIPIVNVYAVMTYEYL